jgi:hypothetical protein
MAEGPEAELDRLFRLAPAALVEARNVLAARLRKAGARELADYVKGLKRPTPAAWALNQLHFEQPLLLQRARAAADQVRALHARDGVEPRQLAAAVAAQRSATNELVAAALERWEAAALGTGAIQRRKLLATIQGWLAGAGQEAPGRMTRDIEHGGFDVITAVGAPALREPLAPPPAPPAQRAAAGAASEAARAPTQAARARAEALARRERQLREAREQVQRRRADQQRAARELDGAQSALRDAETRLAALRDTWSARQAELAQAQAALEAALTAQAEAEQALAAARDAPQHA